MLDLFSLCLWRLQTPGSFVNSLLFYEEGPEGKGSYSLSSLLLDEARDTVLLLTL